MHIHIVSITNTFTDVALLPCYKSLRSLKLKCKKSRKLKKWCSQNGSSHTNSDSLTKSIRDYVSKICTCVQLYISTTHLPLKWYKYI